MKLTVDKILKKPLLHDHEEVIQNTADIGLMLSTITETRKVFLSPDQDEITGYRYQTYAAAAAYVLSDDTPAADNVWGVEFTGGTLTEDVELKAYIVLYGHESGNGFIDGKLTTDGLSAGDNDIIYQINQIAVESVDPKDHLVIKDSYINEQVTTVNDGPLSLESTQQWGWGADLSSLEFINVFNGGVLRVGNFSNIKMWDDSHMFLWKASYALIIGGKIETASSSHIEMFNDLDINQLEMIGGKIIQYWGFDIKIKGATFPASRIFNATIIKDFNYTHAPNNKLDSGTLEIFNSVISYNFTTVLGSIKNEGAYYDSRTSSLSSNEFQGAVDELEANITSLSGSLSGDFVTLDTDQIISSSKILSGDFKVAGNLIPTTFANDTDISKTYKLNSDNLLPGEITELEIQEADGKIAILNGENHGTFNLPMTMARDLSGNINPNINDGVIYKTGPTWSGVDPHVPGPFFHDFNYGNNGSVITEGDNLFIGINAGNFTMGENATASWHASYNVGIGPLSLAKINNGYANLGLGSYAMNSMIDGENNIAVGLASMWHTTVGAANTCLGAYTMGYSTGGENNVSIGMSANYKSSNMENNVCIGYSNFSQTTSPIEKNTSIGCVAGQHCSTSNNTFIGYGAGFSCSTSGTLIIDNQPRTAGATSTNSIIHGMMAPSPENQKIRINATAHLSQGQINNRKTVNSTYNLLSSDYMLSVKPTSNTDINLPTTNLVDGQTYEIYAVNLAFTITIKGSINSATDHSFASARDNIKLVYNADETTWEIR